jgi:hypothetical protein
MEKRPFRPFRGCLGGSEGNRIPDLLHAKEALSAWWHVDDYCLGRTNDHAVRVQRTAFLQLMLEYVVGYGQQV